MPHPPATIVGDLVQALIDAYGDTLAAEARVVDLLYDLLPGWRLLFPARRSWLWTPPDRLDVWGVAETTPAVAALHRAGFAGVRIHPHAAEAFLTCVCPHREARP